MVDPALAPRHVLQDIGHTFALDGERMAGTCEVSPFMFSPGTTAIRTSILAIWVDIAAGLLAVDVFPGRVPTTLDLDVHLCGHPRPVRRIDITATVVKPGRSVAVLRVDMADETGAPYAVGSAAFMPVPDPSVRMPNFETRVMQRKAGELTRPFAEHAEVVRTAPGVAELARTEGGLNAAQTINGGLLALVAEEAVLSAAGPGHTVSSLVLRYVRAARVGPAVARAQITNDVGSVEVFDTGDDDRLAVFGTAATVSLPGSASQHLGLFSG